MTQLLCIVAAFALGQALYLPQSVGFWFLGSACVLVLLAAAAPKGNVSKEARSAVLNFCLAIQCYELVTSIPVMYPEPGTRAGLFRVAAMLATVLIALGQLGPGRWGRNLFPVLLGVFAWLGWWTIHVSPHPAIDVDIFQRDALTYMLKGVDPYSLRPPDIYGGQFNAPELVENGRLTYGYPYPPLSLLMALPGHFLGDYRYSQLGAMLGASAIIAAMKPGRLGYGVAALLLFSPRAFFVLEQGWTEPFVLLLFAGLFYFAVRSRGEALRPVLIGLLLVVKQYMVLVLWPLFVVGAQLRERRALLAAGVVTLPFVLWGPRDFWVSVVRSHWLQPFREDALSFPALLNLPWLAWGGWVLGAGAFAFTLWRQAVTLGGYLLACAAGLLMFFAFGKQAGPNYYWLVSGLLALAVSLYEAEGMEDSS